LFKRDHGHAVLHAQFFRIWCDGQSRRIPITCTGPVAQVFRISARWLIAGVDLGSSANEQSIALKASV